MFLFCVVSIPEMESTKRVSTETPAVQSPPATTGATPDYASGLSATPSYAPATPQPTVQPSGNMKILYLFKKILFVISSLRLSSFENCLLHRNFSVLLKL